PASSMKSGLLLSLHRATLAAMASVALITGGCAPMPRAMIDRLEERRLLAFIPPADPRVVTNLDAGWKFLRADAANAQTVAFNDSSWSNVNVPHTWNNVDGQDGGNDYYRGIGWYRTHITPAAGLVGKSL